MFQKICPCLIWFGEEKKKKPYRPQSQYEQEQFMHNLQEEAKKSDTYQSSDSQNQEISIEDQMNHELGLTKAPPKQVKEKQNKPVLAKLEKEEESKTQISELIQMQHAPKFKINIPEYSEYYEIIMQASKDMDELLSTKDSIETNFNNKLNINKTKLRVFRKATQASQMGFVVEYELPCSYAFYTELLNRNENDQYKNIAQSRLIESIFPNLCSKYLSFHKMSLIDKRDAAYLKYTNGSGKYHWEICISQDSLLESIPNRAKTCKIHSISMLVEQKQEDDQQQILKIKSYMKIDSGINVQKLWEKVYIEYRNYLEVLWGKAENNYEEELV